jgi:hypothetical protein
MVEERTDASFEERARLFVRRNSTAYDYNIVPLEEFASNVCYKYCCLYALYTDRGYTSNQFDDRFAARGHADSHVNSLFVHSPNIVNGQLHFHYSAVYNIQRFRFLLHLIQE